MDTATKYRYRPLGQIVATENNEIVSCRSYRNDGEKERTLKQMKRLHPEATFSFLNEHEMINACAVKSKREALARKNTNRETKVSNAYMMWWERLNAGKAELLAKKHFDCRAYSLTHKQIDYLHKNASL